MTGVSGCDLQASLGVMGRRSCSRRLHETTWFLTHLHHKKKKKDVMLLRSDKEQVMVHYIRGVWGVCRTWEWLVKSCISPPTIIVYEVHNVDRQGHPPCKADGTIAANIKLYMS